MNSHKSNSARILIVDDDDDVCTMLSQLMRRRGYTPLVSHDGAAAIDMLTRESPNLMITDMKMSGIGGLELLHQLKEMAIDLPILVITGYADVGGAVEAMRAGACDYMPKPFSNDRVIRFVDRELKARSHSPPGMGRACRSIAKDGVAGFLHYKMGPSAMISKLARDVERVAHSHFSVVIRGETGSGKEVVARAIHDASRSCNGPFMPVDCGSIQDTLVESELFGYEKGAFTGAHCRKAGLFEAAHGGSLFFDEVANLPLLAQAKLLRVLQEKVVYHLGGHQPIQLDVRILAASHEYLAAKVAQGTFREDLYYRLNDFTIDIPSLRFRKDDIIYLAERFLGEANSDLGKAICGFSGPAIEAMREYSWPGNVRELQACIRRAALFAEGEVTQGHLHLGQEQLAVASSHPVSDETLEQEGCSLKKIVRREVALVEKKAIMRVLQQTNGNKAKAARILKIDYKTMYTKVKQYRL